MVLCVSKVVGGKSTDPVRFQPPVLHLAVKYCLLTETKGITTLITKKFTLFWIEAHKNSLSVVVKEIFQLFLPVGDAIRFSLTISTGRVSLGILF